MNKNNPLRIVFTGPESSGKTTLAKWLSEKLNAPLSSEFTRIYFEERVAREGVFRSVPADIAPLFDGQIECQTVALEVAREKKSRWVIYDTDLISNLVYAKHYFAIEEPSLWERAEEHLGDFYFLAKPDVPWADDPLRDRPHQREELFLDFQAALVQASCTFVVIEGTAFERRRRICEELRNRYALHCNA